MKRALLEYYRCPDDFADFRLVGEPLKEPGFFLFGNETICYGKNSACVGATSPDGNLYDTCKDVRIEGAVCHLPFDPSRVIDNLRFERYVNGFYKYQTPSGPVRDLYYLVRPLMPLSVRKQLHKWHFQGWEKIRFPKWPLDRTVDQIVQRLLGLSLKARNVTKIPFIWFWPDGFPGCAIITQDVETAAGLDFCSAVMEMNDSFKIKSSFQIVPERRYSVSRRVVDDIQRAGFEVNIHDLNHDGHLFTSRQRFLQRAERINRYAKEFNVKGFRSGQLYRNQEWYEALDFSYDMSVPNVAHLDPQAGGCCTVMPYFIGNMVELPLTTTQDYQYFNILGNYSIGLWKQQLKSILENHGLASFLIHPDYIRKKREQTTYRALLAYLSHLRSEGSIWIALPGEVDTWWRQRSQMRLIPDGGSWRVEGPGSERARLANAMADGDRISYTLEQAS